MQLWWASDREIPSHSTGRLSQEGRGTHPCKTDRLEDTLQQHRQVDGHTSTAQTGRGTHPYSTDSEQTPGLITCCRTRWGKKAKLY